MLYRAYDNVIIAHNDGIRTYDNVIIAHNDGIRTYDIVIIAHNNVIQNLYDNVIIAHNVIQNLYDNVIIAHNDVIQNQACKLLCATQLPYTTCLFFVHCFLSQITCRNLSCIMQPHDGGI